MPPSFPQVRALCAVHWAKTEANENETFRFRPSNPENVRNNMTTNTIRDNNLKALDLDLVDLSAHSIVSIGINATRKNALVIIAKVAEYLDDTPTFTDKDQAKSWAQDIRYEKVAPALKIFGEDIAAELSLHSVTEGSKSWAKSYEMILKKTFPCLGKASIRHDSTRKSDPTPSQGVDPETFVVRKSQGTFSCFGVGPKTLKEKGHITDETVRADWLNAGRVAEESENLGFTGQDVEMPLEPWAPKAERQNAFGEHDRAIAHEADTRGYARACSDKNPIIDNLHRKVADQDRTIANLLRVIRNLGDQLATPATPVERPARKASVKKTA